MREEERWRRVGRERKGIYEGGAWDEGSRENIEMAGLDRWNGYGVQVGWTC
jgi:hypothetical protein